LKYKFHKHKLRLLRSPAKAQDVNYIVSLVFPDFVMPFYGPPLMLDALKIYLKSNDLNSDHILNDQSFHT